MFRVKICGITSQEDVDAVASAGADAVGLNFFQPSPRFLAPEKARNIADVLPNAVVRVGLFVNAPIEQILATWSQLRLDLVQLHGDEPPGFLKGLQGRPVMRAFRLGAAGLAPILGYLEMCRDLDCLPRLVLIDSARKGYYGGTGATADWDTARRYPSEIWHPPLILAGGLTADNVGDAIQLVHPSGVDTASGVESALGKKDSQLVRQFTEAARDAFDKIA